jgi:hypothetical protein
VTLTRVPILSPNYSSRGGATVTHIVLHTAEGATTYQSLGSFFQNPSAQVSSHVGIDDTPNVIGEYVHRPNKAWTASGANPWSVQAELCAFARWSTDEWMAHPTMLANCAAWIAEEAAVYGLPLVRLSPSDAQNKNSRGVCDHAALGRMGGGHWDCGGGFPFDHVLSLAGGAAPAPGPAPQPPPPSGTAPPFPYPADHYLGQPSPDARCHSGFYGDPDHSVVYLWQTQMRNRGWNIGVDGNYGPQSQDVCRSFQAEKGLSVDGLVGPQTWSTTWTAPIT